MAHAQMRINPSNTHNNMSFYCFSEIGDDLITLNKVSWAYLNRSHQDV